MNPPWLAGADFYMGEILEFIPSQNVSPAAVVELDSPVSVEGSAGEIVVLELRYVGSTWKDTETVHVELCSFRPPAKPWQSRQQGKWVESHATYKKV